MNKKLFAALAASSVLLAVCTACGESSSQAESSVAETTAAESSAAETSAPESSEAAESVAAEDIEFEEPVVAEDGHAFLYINDGQFYVSYDGTANSLMTYAAGVPEITGDGTYTVSVDAGTKGCQFDIGGDANGDYRCDGLSFAAVIVKGGTTLYPNMCIEIKEIRMDGKPITMNAKNYTSSDDGKEMRANIYNQWVNNFPDDAHPADGAVTGEFGEYSSQIVDPADFKKWQKIEVDFEVTGTDAAGAAAGEEKKDAAAEESEAAAESSEAAAESSEAAESSAAAESSEG